MATFASTDTRGSIIMPDPRWEHMSKNVYVSFPTWEENGGRENVGSPDWIFPLNKNEKRIGVSFVPGTFLKSTVA